MNFSYYTNLADNHGVGEQELHNEGKYHSKNQGIHGKYYISGPKERGFLVNLSNYIK